MERSSLWDHVLLEPEQQELFAAMVEAQRSLGRAERQKFLYIKHLGGASLRHPQFPREENVYEGDLEALADAGLLRPSFGPQGAALYDITPQGYRYYEELKASLGESLVRVERHARSFLDAERFRKAYPDAYAKWQSAEEMLWASDSTEQQSNIGHICREAMIQFVDVLVERFQPPDVDSDRARTVNRLRAVLYHRAAHLGQTERVFLEALVDYWYTVSDLVQRQEHAALREGEELVWEDGRRVVFQTLVAMYEVDRSLA